MKTIFSISNVEEASFTHFLLNILVSVFVIYIVGLSILFNTRRLFMAKMLQTFLEIQSDIIWEILSDIWAIRLAFHIIHSTMKSMFRGLPELNVR